jgi:hypothetical protein
MERHDVGPFADVHNPSQSDERHFPVPANGTCPSQPISEETVLAVAGHDNRATESYMCRSYRGISTSETNHAEGQTEIRSSQFRVSLFVVSTVSD